jgi:transposase
VAWLGEMDESGRLGIENAAEGGVGVQRGMFEDVKPEWYEKTALSDLPGIPSDRVNDDRLYRALDKILPHKGDLEKHLKDKIGSLFKVDYDLYLYDVTSSYFEGQAKSNPLAKRGYSRDRRGDCKQVCIGLVVTRDGFPLGHEIFAANRTDVTTVKEIIETMEYRYGKANRIWVMDRPMAGEANFDFLNQGGRRYILGANRGQLKQYESELLKADWRVVHSGLEVKLVDGPEGKEVFILCRSKDRTEKEKAMHDRFEQRIEEALRQIAKGCEKLKYKVKVIERRVGKLLGKNSRSAGLFDVEVSESPSAGAQITWTKKDKWREWFQLSEGCYMLRSNIRDWSPEELWKAYIQLTEAENAFRIHKSDLSIRPVWHQKEERVQAHIPICFPAYVLWKTLGRLCHNAGLGDEPRKVLRELAQIKLTDVIPPTRNGTEIRLPRIETPDAHQRIILHRLKLSLPRKFQRHTL